MNAKGVLSPPRRALVALTALAATAALASPAAPAGKGDEKVIDYAGRLVEHPESRVWFTLVKQVDGKSHIQPAHPLAVTSFDAFSIPTTCAGGPDETYIEQGFNARVRHRRFLVKEISIDSRSPARATIEGRLLRNGEARGTLRVVEKFDGVTVCDTGTLRWRAKRKKGN